MLAGRNQNRGLAAKQKLVPVVRMKGQRRRAFRRPNGRVDRKRRNQRNQNDYWEFQEHDRRLVRSS
jgi:hypothetical protein